MKKLQMVLVAGVCLALSTPQKSFSQTSVPFQLAVSSLIASSANEAVVPPVASEASVNNKAVLHFHTAYPAASETRWSTNSEGSTVRFVASGMTIYETYDRKGRWTGTLRNLSNSQVPDDIVKRINFDFSEFQIRFAQDVRTPSGYVYVIKIDSGKEIKTLTVTDEDINVIEDFMK